MRYLMLKAITIESCNFELTLFHVAYAQWWNWRCGRTQLKLQPSMEFACPSWSSLLVSKSMSTQMTANRVGLLLLSRLSIPTFRAAGLKIISESKHFLEAWGVFAPRFRCLQVRPSNPHSARLVISSRIGWIACQLKMDHHVGRLLTILLSRE